MRLAVVAMGLMAATVVEGQKYSDIYDGLPNMTLDQQYNVLLDFQKSNPYFPNTYIQLGSICEKRMILFDPLKDNESVRFWAQNALLFYGNLKVYYKPGDIKSQWDYYENLHIPYSGKRAEDDDMWAYVKLHSDLCKNHSDTTTLIYSAIERSKFNYDMCLMEFKSICNDYIDMNDLLLRNSPELDKRIEKIGKNMDECVKEFNEYKRLTKLYPVMNYKQFYEMKEIETFRLDGLTNSDFYNNRFTMWDYRKWADEYYKTLKESILPLRKEIADINDRYMRGREDFEKGKTSSEMNAKAGYDELFLFRLGNWDNASVVRPLFAYLDATRELVDMGGDSLGRNIVWSETLEARKMRRLYKMEQQMAEISKKREALLSMITDQRVARFAEFFSKNYGGAEGLKKFAEEDETYCRGVIEETAKATAAYKKEVEQKRREATDIYSTATAKQPQLAMWVSIDPKSLTTKHVTTCVGRDRQQRIRHVSGYMKANNKSWFVGGISATGVTEWVTALKNVNSVTSVETQTEGCIVNAIRALKPCLIRIGGDGQEIVSVEMKKEVTDVMGVDAVSGRIYWTTGNAEGKPEISGTDSLGVKAFETGLTMLRSVKQVEPMTDGYVVIGIGQDGNLMTVKVSADGTVGETKRHGEGVKEIVLVSRYSATEVGVLTESEEGKNTYKVIGIR